MSPRLLSLCIFLGAAMILSASVEAELTLRISVVHGAPRLLVNGRPVRARMFFGGPGSNPIRVGPEGRHVEFEFTANSGAPGDGTMHFRFGQTPGDVYIDNVRVTDAATGRDVVPLRDFEQGPGAFSAHWVYFPPEPQNTVGEVAVKEGAGQGGTAGLHVKLKVPPDGRWPDYHIYHAPNLRFEQGRTYRVSLWCRAEPARDLTVAFYRPGQTFVYLGGPPGRFESQIRLAAGAGVDFVTFIVPTPWPEPGEKADWTAVDAEVDRVLRANPKALLIPRFGLDPPPWWAKAHPDEMMVWEDGSRQHTAVPASPLYQHDAAERTAALVAHLEEKYGDRMAGYHPCGQNTGEWFYQDTWGALLNGYSRADLEGWRAWLRARYIDDAHLQAAWRDPSVTLANVVVPSREARRAAPNGALRDPASERRLVDFAEYQQQAMADLVCALARAARTASRGRKLVVFFYGYGFEFGAVALGPATSGHYAMRQVLQCPDIDLLCSPISYGDRGLGESGPVMSAAESVALAGKMWLQEDDTRTHLSPAGPDAIARLDTLAATCNVLARNVANEATRNFATWWMDLGMSGWFDDPALWDLMRRLEPLDRPFVERPIPFRPQVAAVLDERAMLLVAPGAFEITFPAIYGARHQLGRMGAPYGQYLMDDVAAGRIRARVYVFLNAWRLSAAQRRALLRATRGAVRVWCYAPGAYDQAGPNPNGMRELTGFRLAAVRPAKAWAAPTEVGKRLGLTRAFGVEKAVTPLYAAVDAQADETLAVYPDGSAAVALRSTPDGISLFVGAPGLTPEILRVAVRKAGAHLYTSTDCCVYASGPFVALHAVRDGPVQVDTGTHGAVRDALTGEVVGHGPKITLTLKRGDTRILHLGRMAERSGRNAPQKERETEDHAG